MVIVDRATRERLRTHFARGSVHPDDQTRMTLFIQSVKAINSAVLARVEFQPFDPQPAQALQQQYLKEVEAATRLGKATAWSSSPMLYMEATNLNLELWNRTGAALYLQGLLSETGTFFRYLALSHALLDVVRIVPLMPEDMPGDTVFMQALTQVEEESARQVRVQEALLLDLSGALEQRERERTCQHQREQVVTCFQGLLKRIGA